MTFRGGGGMYLERESSKSRSSGRAQRAIGLFMGPNYHFQFNNLDSYLSDKKINVL